MKIPHDQIRIGRVLHEDDGFLTIEVPKDLTKTLRIEDGDKFLSFIFVHHVHGVATTWIPWEDQ